MRKGFVSLGGALAIMLVIAVSFFAGTRTARQADPAPTYAIAGTPVPTELQQPLSDLMQGYNALNHDSYYRPLDHRALIYGAIQGMLSSAHPADTHTVYLPPTVNTYESASLQETGSYGIGAAVTMSARGLTVKPLIDSPAAKAGLRVGDLIVAVNGTSVLTMTADDAVKRIHGSAGTSVALTIVRPGVAKPFVVRVVRGAIPSVLPLQFGPNGSIGYIQFAGFDTNTGNEVHDALVKLLAQHIHGLILDLRDNGGGYVSTAVQIASEFLPRNAVIFYERNHLDNGKYVDTPTVVSKPGIAERLPIVVLVNGNSASAAEILTAALHEHHRGVVMGEKTYGKGSVQEDLSLPDGAAFRITIRLWLTPEKHSIQDVGISPDVMLTPGFTGDQDNEITRAVSYLQGIG